MFKKFYIDKGILVKTLIPVILLTSVFVVLFFSVFLPKYKDVLINQKKKALKNYVEIGMSILENNNQRVLSGERTLEEAKEASMRYLKELRFGTDNKNYFYINDLNHKLLMHPYKPELVGKDLTDYKDNQGNYVFRNIVKAAKKEGGDFTNYYWQRFDDPDDTEEKISFVKVYKPWNIVLGTGVYLGDIQREISVMKKNVMFYFVPGFSIFLMLTLFFAGGLVKSELEVAKTSERLKISNIRLKLLFENSTDGMFLQNERGEILECNQKALDMFGMESLEELNQHSILELSSDVQLDGTASSDGLIIHIKNALSDGYENFEWIHKNKNGEFFVASVRLVAFEYNQGKLIYATIKDITEKKKSEQRIIESENRFRALFEESPFAIALFDKEGNLESTNRSFDLMFNYNHDEDSFNINNSKYVEDESLKTKINSLFNGIVIYVDSIFLNNNPFTGKEDQKTMKINGYPLKGEENNIDQVIMFFEDITVEKQRQLDIIENREKLKKALEELNFIMENMSDFIYRVNKDDKVDYVSKSVEKIIGYSQEDIIKSYNEKGGFFISLNEKNNIYKKNFEKYIEIFKDKSQHSDNVEVITADGKKIILEINEFPIIENEEIIAVMGIARDITRRLKLQEVITQTEKMMSVGGLAAGMAHEINNPLGGIINGIQNVIRRLEKDREKNIKVAVKLGLELDIMNQYLEDREIIKLLNNITVSARRAADIVSNMLEFSKKSGGEKKKTSLSEIISKTIDIAKNDFSFENKYDFKHVKIKKSLEPGLEIFCIRSEIEQVIFNILKNASKAMYYYDKKHPVIFIETYAEDENAVLKITDNGPGMPDEVRKRIFEPFFTADETKEGTGLGLSVSYYIITENHGGTIRVNSEEGKGTEFIIHLPI